MSRANPATTHDNSNVCTISFSSEAHDSAAHVYRNLLGWNADVTLNDGETFNAELGEVSVDDEDGQYKITVWKWDDETGRGDRSKERVLDIYEDIDRVEIT